MYLLTYLTYYIVGTILEMKSAVDDNRSLRENDSYGLLNDNRTACVYTVVGNMDICQMCTQK